MTPPLSLSALLALIEEATPGPWEVMGLTGERLGDSSDVTNDDGDFITCRGFTDDSTGWCGWCCALDAIESVRELVDLGEKP